jgi:hypothetical protein
VHQQLRDLSNLRRVDAFLKAAGSRKLVLEPQDAVGTAAVEHCISCVRQLINDTKRSTAMVMFYLDNSPVKSPRPPIPIHCINETLAEGVHGKGNIAALFHMLVVSSDAKIIRDVLRLFRAILDKPTSAALARLKPFVRRNVAETLAVMGRAELRALLGKLLLHNGMDTSAVPGGTTGKAAGSSDDAAAASSFSSAAPAGVQAAESLMCNSPQATSQRRSTLRLLTLVLDGVDESIDQFASQLVEVPMCALYNMLETFLCC